MARLTEQLWEQTKESSKRGKPIWANLKDLGHG